MKKAYTIPSLKTITLASESIICGSLTVTDNSSDKISDEHKALSSKTSYSIHLWGEADQ